MLFEVLKCGIFPARMGNSLPKTKTPDKLLAYSASHESAPAGAFMILAVFTIPKRPCRWNEPICWR